MFCRWKVPMHFITRVILYLWSVSIDNEMKNNILIPVDRFYRAFCSLNNELYGATWVLCYNCCIGSPYTLQPSLFLVSVFVDHCARRLPNPVEQNTADCETCGRQRWLDGYFPIFSCNASFRCLVSFWHPQSNHGTHKSVRLAVSLVLSDYIMVVLLHEIMVPYLCYVCQICTPHWSLQNMLVRKFKGCPKKSETATKMMAKETTAWNQWANHAAYQLYIGNLSFTLNGSVGATLQ